MFSRIAKAVTHFSGSKVATCLAFLIVTIWLVGGLFVGYTTDYQMYINTGTTIITFLMVFLIQHEQNCDTRAIHAKLDELIRAIDNAREEIMDEENKTVEEIEKDILEMKGK